MSKKSEPERERTEAIDRLRRILKPGDTVHCVLRHVSRSGMFRVIDLQLVRGGNVGTVGRLAARALSEKYDTAREGVRVSGCGMDMGFHLVYNLAVTLWPKGYGCTGEGCQSNDHSNGDRDYTPHCQFCADRDAGPIVAPGYAGPSLHEHPAGRAHWHRDGGYALRHRWI